jgi:RimJ/RimL family protein N-acetyltransferase
MLLPAEAAAPEERRTGRLLLRPLRASDVQADYDAVISSAAMLRRWSQSVWPADDFTLAENLADLERHEREHVERVAFTYTVLDPADARCLGCAYVQPLAAEEAAAWRGAARRAARVAFWVRESELAGELDRHLLEGLQDWFREAWPFDRVVFSASPGDERQLRIYDEAGLTRLGVVSRADGRRLSGHLGS